VNGQYQPIVQAQPGEALRLRLVHGGNNDHMYGERGGGGGGGAAGCTLLTLARDGVYLEAPRRQGGGAGHVLVAPGSRADLAVACDRPGVYRLSSSRGGD
ncbi:unnamed protein product, partial [Laminaria digitata]